MTIENKKRIEFNTHHWLKDENGISVSSNRVKDGTHNWLGKNVEMKEFQLTRVKNGTHHWLGKSNPVHDQIKDGTHHFLSSEYQSNLQRKRIAEGTHHMLGGKIQQKTQRNLVRKGIHHFQKSVPCIDINGDRIVVPSEKFHSQMGNKDQWEYVSFNSNEAKKRIANKTT